MYQEDEGRRNSLSWGRGQGEGPFPWHPKDTDRRTETRHWKTYGFGALIVLRVGLCHTLGNPPEPKSTHEFP